MVNLCQRLRRLQSMLALLPPPGMKKNKKIARGRLPVQIQVMEGMGR
jgi:hypothetical protein